LNIAYSNNLTRLAKAKTNAGKRLINYLKVQMELPKKKQSFAYKAILFTATEIRKFRNPIYALKFLGAAVALAAVEYYIQYSASLTREVGFGDFIKLLNKYPKRFVFIYVNLERIHKRFQ